MFSACFVSLVPQTSASYLYSDLTALLIHMKITMYCLIRTNNKKYDVSTFTTAAYPGHSLTSLHLTIFAQQSRICGQTQINRTRFTVSLLVRISTHTDIIKFYFCYLRTQIKAKYELAWLISVNTYTFDTFRITTVFRVVSFLIQLFTLSCA
jgi:hypothetical protein